MYVQVLENDSLFKTLTRVTYWLSDRGIKPPVVTSSLHTFRLKLSVLMNSSIAGLCMKICAKQLFASTGFLEVLLE